MIKSATLQPGPQTGVIRIAGAGGTVVGLQMNMGRWKVRDSKARAGSLRDFSLDMVA